MKSKSITFYRYILSYALVLFLPIVLLFTLFNSILLDRYKQEIADNNTRLLTQIQENMDTQLEQLINISFMIQNTPTVPARNTASLLPPGSARKSCSPTSWYMPATHWKISTPR